MLAGLAGLCDVTGNGSSCTFDQAVMVEQAGIARMVVIVAAPKPKCQTRGLQTYTLLSVQATAAVQTESSVGRDQPAALVSTSMQTLSQAEQDLDLAQQGRLPLPEADFKLCRVITGCLRRATEQACQGFIMEAERNVCMVSLPFCSPYLAINIQALYPFCVYLIEGVSTAVFPSSASLAGLPSKHVVASIPSFLFRWSVLNLALPVLRHKKLFQEGDISLAHFSGFQSLTCLIPVCYVGHRCDIEPGHFCPC